VEDEVCHVQAALGQVAEDETDHAFRGRAVGRSPPGVPRHRDPEFATLPRHGLDARGVDDGSFGQKVNEWLAHPIPSPAAPPARNPP